MIAARRCFAALVCLSLLAVDRAAWTCPFCSAVNRTFAEQMDTSDAVVVARLAQLPEDQEIDLDRLPKALFAVAEVIKGKDLVAVGTEVETILVGEHQVGELFLMMGVDAPDLSWTTPLKTSQRVVDYLKKVPELPAAGAERLKFFQQHLEDSETVLAYDAYDEFARAPYADVLAMKDGMPHDRLIKWILDPDVMKSRKRLYFTMLGICGTDEDLPMLEELINSGDREKQAGLDALIACYLILKGPEGMPLIEQQFLSNAQAEYIDTFAAIQALRFHGTETDVIPRERIAEGLRLVLQRPKMADMVIPDLARMQDWSVVDQLVEMFKNADEQTRWVRTPIISYLQECPKPEAKQYIEQLRKIDPDAIRRAELMAQFQWDQADDSNEKVQGKSDDSAEKKKEKDGADKQPSPGPEQAASSPDDPSRRQTNKKVPMAGPIEEGSEPPVWVGANLGGANPDAAVFVSTGEPQASEAPRDVPRGTTASELPLANMSGMSFSMAILLVPFAISALLFVLLWSVLNGWFERLIF